MEVRSIHPIQSPSNLQITQDVSGCHFSPSLQWVMEDKFRLDRTAFKAGTVEEADDNVTDWKDKTPGERLEAAWYLINKMYGTTPQTRLDRTVFSKRKRN